MRSQFASRRALACAAVFMTSRCRGHRPHEAKQPATIRSAVLVVSSRAATRSPDGSEVGEKEPTPPRAWPQIRLVATARALRSASSRVSRVVVVVADCARRPRRVHESFTSTLFFFSPPRGNPHVEDGGTESKGTIRPIPPVSPWLS
ncbi:unnamed protein product [Lampetra planeri]